MAVNVVAMGGEASIVSVVGGDAMGDRLRSELSRQGIRVIQGTPADALSAPTLFLKLWKLTRPNEPARIYFGGDEDIVFKDFSVDALTGEMLMGDFNSNGTITEADWAILRDNMHTNLSSLTLAQAFFLGDLTGDKANNHDDYVAFKILYEDANGAGSFARMLAGVPEPSTLLLFVVGLLSTGLARRRGANRG